MSDTYADPGEEYRGLAGTTEEGLGGADGVTIGAAPDLPEPEEEAAPLFERVPRELAAHRRAFGGGIRDEGHVHHEDEVPAAVRGFLVPGEEHAMASGLHPCSMGRKDAVVLGALAAAITLHVLLYQRGLAYPPVVKLIWVSFIIAAGWWGWQVIVFRSTWIVITPKRIMTVVGFPTQRVTSLPWRRARDVELSQTVTGRTFGYGTLRLLSIGTDHALANVKYVPNVAAVYRVVWAILQPTQGKSPMAEDPW